jgi:hypothetical protein
MAAECGQYERYSVAIGALAAGVEELRMLAQEIESGRARSITASPPAPVDFGDLVDGELFGVADLRRRV